MFTGHHVSNKWSYGDSLCVYCDIVTYVNFYRTVTSGGSNRWCECWSPWDVDKRLDNELWWQWSWWLYDDDGWIQSNKAGEVHWASRNCMFFFNVSTQWTLVIVFILKLCLCMFYTCIFCAKQSYVTEKVTFLCWWYFIILLCDLSVVGLSLLRVQEMSAMFSSATQSTWTCWYLDTHIF